MVIQSLKGNFTIFRKQVGRQIERRKEKNKPSVKYDQSSRVTIRSEIGFRYLCKIGFKGSAFRVQGSRVSKWVQRFRVQRYYGSPELLGLGYIEIK